MGNNTTRIDELYAMATNLTELIARAENSHLAEHWHMLFGSVVIPELVKEDPAVLDRNPGFKTIMDAYTKEEVLAKLAPRTEPVEVEKFVEIEKIVNVEVPVEKIVEKIVEVPVEVEKLVERIVHIKVPVGGNVRVDPGHDTCDDGGKFRRLKDSGIDKLTRKKRAIDSDVRDTIITWWNVNQTLVSKGDPVCQWLANECNAANPSLEKLSALQVAGYISRLVTWGLMTSNDRTTKFDKHMKLGVITIRPQYTKRLLQAMTDNYNAQREDEAVRRKAHGKMRDQKGSRVFAEASTEEAPEITGTPGVVAPATPVRRTLASTPAASITVEGDDTVIS